MHKPSLPTAAEVALETGKKAVEEISVTFNGTDITIKKNRLTFTLNGQLVKGDALLNSNDRLELNSINESPITFGDIFSFTDYSLPKNSKGNYQLLRNDKPIGFNDPIFGGDILEIAFQTK